MILTPELSYETDCRFHVPRKGSYLGRKLELSFLQDIEKLIRKKVPVLALPALTIPQVAKSVVHHTPQQSGQQRNAQQRNGAAHRSEKPAHARGQFRGHGAPQKRFSRGRAFQQG